MCPNARKPTRSAHKILADGKKVRVCKHCGAELKEGLEHDQMKKKYQEEVAPALMKKFSYKSPMQIPKIEKIVVNVGCGEARDTPRCSTPSSAIWARSPARRPL